MSDFYLFLCFIIFLNISFEFEILYVKLFLRLIRFGEYLYRLEYWKLIIVYLFYVLIVLVEYFESLVKRCDVIVIFVMLIVKLVKFRNYWIFWVGGEWFVNFFCVCVICFV